MKYKLANRMINGSDLTIRNPETGHIIKKDDIIDTELMEPDAIKYFRRVYAHGDLTIIRQKGKM